MVTLKLKYTTENHERVVEMIRNYNSIFGLCYNFMFSHPKASTKEIIEHVNSKNNIFLDTYFKNGTIYDAKTEITQSKDKRIVFGGVNLFKKRCNHKISQDEFRLKRLRPLMVVGASHNNGNCKFQIVDKDTVVFKPNRYEHFTLNLFEQGKNYKKRLNRLKYIQDNKLAPLTYKLGLDCIYITYDYTVFEQLEPVKAIKNRQLAIDLNPNYIGYTVTDWKDGETYNILDAGVISLKPLNDVEYNLKRKRLPSNSPERLYTGRKRRHEVIETAHELVNLAKHYRCELFVVEQLSIKSSDKNKGKRFNRLCNNLWCRDLLTNVIVKLCEPLKITYLEVVPEYSSFVGNLVYRNEKLPDMCLASLEISRRGYEFNHQYVLKDKEKEKNIVFNNSAHATSKASQSLEELGVFDAWTDLKNLYSIIKKRNCKYRFPLVDALQAHKSSFSSNHTKAYKVFYKFV